MNNDLSQSLYLEALVKVEEAVRALNVLKAVDPSREASLAATNVEQGQLWLMAAEHRIPEGSKRAG